MLQAFRHSGDVNSQIMHEQIVLSTVGMSRVSVSAQCRTGAWPTNLVITVETTPNGVDWDTASYIDEADGVATAVATFTASARRRYVPVEDLLGIRARITTISTAAHGYVSIDFYGLAELAAERSAAGQSNTLATAGPGGPGGGGSLTAPAPGGGDV